MAFTPDEFQQQSREVIDALAALPLASLHLLAACFPNATSRPYFEHDEDEDRRRREAVCIYNALRELRDDRQRLGEFIGALRTLGVPVGRG